LRGLEGREGVPKVLQRGDLGPKLGGEGLLVRGRQRHPQELARAVLRRAQEKAEVHALVADEGR